MNFDYSNVLTRAGQISWKHKSIWGLLALPMLAGFLPLILFFILFLVIAGVAESDVSEAVIAVLAVVFLLLFILSAAVNYVVNSVSISAATLGIVRAERGEGSTQFMDLLRDGLPYFWRILGVMLVINLTIGLTFTLFNLLALLLILVTLGMASVCIQPIVILLMPFTFLMIGILEVAQLAVIVENMSVMDAVKHALQVVRAHVWKYVIITMIVYFGSSILTSIFVTPLMLPIFFVPFLFEFGREMSAQGAVLIFAFFFCVSFPVMMLISSVIGVFMKTSLDLTYLRLKAFSKQADTLSNL